MVDKPFLAADRDIGLEPPSDGNKVDFFTDNVKLYEEMARDIAGAVSKGDFVYLANWWCDLSLPMGDPRSTPRPATLRDVLTRVGRVVSDQRPWRFTRWSGPQVCGIFWRQVTVLGIRPPLIPIFTPSMINADAAAFISSLNTRSHGFLDAAHRAMGSHHQKILLIRKGPALVAYLGSTDFNADRIYPTGFGAAHKTSSIGAPLEDVNCRIEGPAADTVLRGYVTRWDATRPQAPKLDGKGVISAPVHGGTLNAQITYTYGARYPFRHAVTSAAASILNLISQAKHYIYVEDQYLFGTPQIADALRDRLNSQLNLQFIAVMSPLDIPSFPSWELAPPPPGSAVPLRKVDLRTIACHRFWSPLAPTAFPGRVRIFEMTNAAGQTTGPGSYLHSKLLIVDDEVASLGSVNFSRRSMTHDSEILATIQGNAPGKPATAAGQLRVSRWSRHLRVPARELVDLPAALARWKTLPFGALVRPWLPDPSIRWPGDTDRLAFESIIDPA